MLGPARPKDLSDASLYRYLAERRGIAVTLVDETFEPLGIEAADAEHLDLAPGTAVFRSHRVAQDVGGAVIEVSDSPIRADLCRFTLRRSVGSEVS